jgi:YVTN family beta-propeller protein
MINKQKLYSIALVSAAMVLMLISIAGAAPHAYITNSVSSNVSVIDTATNQVTATVNVGSYPYGVAITPDGTKVYVANEFSNNVSVIDTATNKVTATVNVGSYPYGVAITPDGKKVYVTMGSSPGNVYVIDTNVNNVTTYNTVIATVNVGSYPYGVAVTPDGTKVYVANSNYGSSGTVSVIDTNVNNVTTYNTVIATVPVGNSPYVIGQFIGKAISTITWNPNPTTITYGTPLVAGQLNAQSSASGTFTYKDGSTPLDTTTVLSAGTHTLTATFTSTDPNYASGGTVTATITVNKATPTITWLNPADITYGTPLSSTQLDATASVPGNFVYTPLAGTVLSAGLHQTLSVIFTPTDTADYNTVSAIAYINVQSPALEITKKASPITYDYVGQIITYTYTVKNVGNVDIKGPITVTDDKFGTIAIPNSNTLSKGSSVTGTDTYKITDADINAGSVTNSAYATGSFNGYTITSPKALAVVLYKHREHHEEHQNDERGGDFGPNDGFGPRPMIGDPGPMMCGPMYGNEQPYGYGSEPYGPTETLNSESNVHKS